MVVPAEVQDLVDNPRETLEVELKEWLDLSEGINRANTARHLCALANHGGGYLIFGVRDDLSYVQTAPADLSAYSRDQVSGIVQRYLTPTFQCDVFSAQVSGNSQQCVVVRVPSHGSVPICARSNGPSDGRGRTQGIHEGEHYTRMPGPKSEPIKSAEHWQPVIHRCVLSERQALLESIGRILGGGELVARSTGTTLSGFHDAMAKQIKELLK